MTRLAESEALMKIIGDPRVNGSAILKRYVGAVLNDKAVADQMVPDEPNKTPEQVVQMMEQQKQAMTNQLDLQIKQTELQITQLDLQIAEQKFIEARYKAEHPQKATSNGN